MMHSKKHNAARSHASVVLSAPSFDSLSLKPLLKTFFPPDAFTEKWLLNPSIKRAFGSARLMCGLFNCLTYVLSKDIQWIVAILQKSFREKT